MDFTAPARVPRSLLSPCFELHCLSSPCAEAALQGSCAAGCQAAPGHCMHPVCPHCHKLCQCHCTVSPVLLFVPSPRASPPAQLLLSGTESPNTPGLCPAGTLLLPPAHPHPGAQAQSALTATISYSVLGCSSVNAAWGEEKAAFPVSLFQKL